MIITECQEFYGDCGNSKRERTLDTLGLCLKLGFLSHKLKSLVIPKFKSKFFNFIVTCA